MKVLRRAGRLFAASILFTASLQAQMPRRGGEKPPPDIANASYGPHERNVLDLWKAKTDQPAPLVVFIHGGSFRRGSKAQLSARLLEGLLERGISVMAIHYRLSPEVTFPAHYVDAARAIQFARYMAGEWNIDPTRVGATGGSAGGCTSLWIGFHDDFADPMSPDPVLRQSTRLSCMAVERTQSTLNPRVIRELLGEPGARAAEEALPGFIGVAPDEIYTPYAQALYEAASALNFLTPDDPPVYASYEGPREISPHLRENQAIHHYIFGVRLKQRMDALGIECVLRHRDEGADTDREMAEFFARHLGTSKDMAPARTTRQPRDGAAAQSR